MCSPIAGQSLLESEETRFEARDAKATYRLSPDIDAELLLPSPCAPDEFTETRTVIPFPAAFANSLGAPVATTTTMTATSPRVVKREVLVRNPGCHMLPPPRLQRTSTWGAPIVEPRGSQRRLDSNPRPPPWQTSWRVCLLSACGPPEPPRGACVLT